MLAASDTTRSTGSGTLLTRLDVPTQGVFLQDLHAMNWLPAALLLVLGLVYLSQGWKAVKVLIVLNAAAIGALLGWIIGQGIQGDDAPLYTAVAGAILLGAMSFPTMKYSLAVMGGLAGSIVGFVTWRYLSELAGRPDIAQHAWAGALIGLTLLGLLAFVLFRFSVIVITAGQGAVMAVSGALALLLKHHGLQPRVESTLLSNALLLPLLIVLPAAIGFIIQESQLAKKLAKKRRRSSSSSSSSS
jgi:hypothetical protein